MEQMKDIMPSAMTAIVMLAAVLLVGTLALPVPVLLIVQVLAGVLVYAALSVVLRLKPFYFLLNIVRSRKTKEV